MAEISLSKGYVAIVDEIDLPLLSAYRWRVKICKTRSGSDSSPYALADLSVKGARETIYMHRLVLNAGPGQIVDHANGNSLDNRRCNLRFCTVTENNLNSRKKRDGLSRFKGVSLDPNYKKMPWRARGYIGGRCVFQKHFETELEAARAYDAWAASTSVFARPNLV